MALALVVAFACVTHRGNQVVAAMAVNIMVAGLAPALALAWFDQGGQTPQLDDGPRQSGSPGLPGPGSHEPRCVTPLPGLAYAELLSGHNIIVYFAAVFVPASAWVLYRTRFGLRLRAVGENPLAVDTAGISVNLLRYQACVISGVLCGIAGTYIATAASSGFVRDMTAGKGYLALAGSDLRQVETRIRRWLPVSCSPLRMRGAAPAFRGVFPFRGWEWCRSRFIIALPYILTVLLLAGFVGEAVAPKAIGVPYSKGKIGHP